MKISFGAPYLLYSASLSYISHIITGCVVGTLVSIAGIVLNSLVLYIFWKSLRMTSKMSYIFHDHGAILNRSFSRNNCSTLGFTRTSH